MTVNAETYRKMCKEDLDWLRTVPRTLERDHVEVILLFHIQHAERIVELTRELCPQVPK